MRIGGHPFVVGVLQSSHGDTRGPFLEIACKSIQ
jgi:hypothetical protein